MGVKKHTTKVGVFWEIDVWLTFRDRPPRRFRKRRIPTREMAEAMLAKAKTEAFEGRYFDRKEVSSKTVREMWLGYKSISERDNRTHRTEKARAEHLIRHLGDRQIISLTERDVDHYRARRFAEKTKFKKPPSPATLDKEVELLKRMLNYEVRCGEIEKNPIAHARLLRVPNVRRQVFGEMQFEQLFENADVLLQPILLTAFDTGMRKEEILALRWDQVNLKDGVIRLAPQDTKTKKGRAIYLRKRLIEALETLPRQLHSPFIFNSPETGTRWKDIKKMWARALENAKLEGYRFHDLRRSFVTNARRVHGIPESVIMKMSGHETRAVFDRYNIVFEEDVKAAVEKMDQNERNSTARSGQDLDKVEE